MAFSENVGGERYNLRVGNTVPMRMSAALVLLVAAGTAHKFTLVKKNATNDQIDQCAVNDIPYGYIFSLTGGIDMATVLEWRSNLLYVEYAGAAPAIGNKVVANGTAGVIPIGGFLRDQVKVDNTNGLAVVRNVDEYATGVALVQTYLGTP